MALPILDLYLARGFIPYPVVWSQLAAQGADPVLAEETWMRFLNTLRPTNIETYTQAFGPPFEERDGCYVWPLTLWPDHRWVVGFQDIPSLGPNAPLGVCEIARRVPARPERVSPLSVDGARRALRLGYDTTAEVQAALGDAPKYDGWWPWDSWEYDLPDGSPLQCEFAHNVLVAITQEALHDPIISRQTHTSPDRPASSS